MSQPPIPPRLTEDGELAVTKRTFVTFDCPKCHRSLDITRVAFGTTIECPECKNITWAPEYRPKWWHKTRHFVASVFIALVIGILSTIMAPKIVGVFTDEEPSPTNSTLEEGIDDAN